MTKLKTPRLHSGAQAAAVVNIAEKAAKLGYFIFDVKEKRTRFASEGLKHIVMRAYGGKEDVSIEDLFARVHKHDRRRVISSVFSTINNATPLDIEFRVLCDDGDILYLWMTNAEIDDSEEGLVRVGIVQDLTERHARETVLQENVALKRAIVDAALDAVVIIDDEGVICDFNPTAEELFGYEKADVIGKKLATTIVPEKYRAAHEAGMERYLKSGEPHVIGQRIDIEAVKKSGEEFPIELAIKQINVGDRLLFTSNIRDISDRRAIERQQAEHKAELEQAKEAAEAANKAKSEFLAAMSHEIRTPLNGVLGVLTLLGDTELTQEQRQLLDTAYGSGQNLFSLISDVLDISKIEAGKMDQELVDFNPMNVVKEAASLVEAISNKKAVRVTIDALTELTTVRGDQAQIRQILTNLVSNATKFTHEGSIRIRIGHEAGLLRFEVEDTGIGIDKVHQSKLFKKFSQVDPSTRRRYGGTGLGLSICHELVHLLGGDIGFNSIKGIGSTFWFEIPVNEAETSIVEGDSDLGSISDLTIPFRILLAEDSNTNALVASSFLRSAGARVDIASNGLDVLTATSNRQYDLIIMDVSMPGMDGIETSEELRAQNGWTQKVPIIALTANASREDKDRCMQAGMDAFLTKPIDRPKLLKTVYDTLNSETLAGEKVRSKEPSAANEHFPVFDKTSIRQNFDDLPDLFRTVIQTFQDEINERLCEAEDALKNGNFEKLARTGHALKGAAANVHADVISTTGKSLELSAKSGDLAAVEEAITILRELIMKAEREIPELPYMSEAS